MNFIISASSACDGVSGVIRIKHKAEIREWKREHRKKKTHA